MFVCLYIYIRTDRDSLLQPKDSNPNDKKYVPRLSLTFIPVITEKIVKITKNHWQKISDLFEFPLSVSYKNSITIQNVLEKKCRYPVLLNYSFSEVENKVLDLDNINNTKEKCLKRSCKTCDTHLVVPDRLHCDISLGMINLKLPVHLKNCESKNLIYLLTCSNCKDKHYVGETLQQLCNRMYGYRSQNSVVNSKHFNIANHTVDDMRVLVLHKVSDSASTIYRRGVEYFYLMTVNPDLNVDLAPP